MGANIFEPPRHTKMCLNMLCEIYSELSSVWLTFTQIRMCIHSKTTPDHRGFEQGSRFIVQTVPGLHKLYLGI